MTAPGLDFNRRHSGFPDRSGHEWNRCAHHPWCWHRSHRSKSNLLRCCSASTRTPTPPSRKSASSSSPARAHRRSRPRLRSFATRAAATFCRSFLIDELKRRRRLQLCPLKRAVDFHAISEMPALPDGVDELTSTRRAPGGPGSDVTARIPAAGHGPPLRTGLERALVSRIACRSARFAPRGRPNRSRSGARARARAAPASSPESRFRP